MSVWAQSWAYEQRLGKWRDLKSGRRLWKGDPGAKSVLAAVATFADEAGYAYCGQGTLAEMTDMTERSVREHLHNLEHAYGKIRREHRRKRAGRGKGEYTSDGIWLLAPAHRLRPPRRGDSMIEYEPAENFAGGEKRTHGRKSLPPGGRKSLPGNRKGFEPSGNPLGNAPPHRADTYVEMIEIQSQLLGSSLDEGDLGKVGAYAKVLIEKHGATRAQMMRWATHYTTRRSESSRIQPSQAWTDVLQGSAYGYSKPFAKKSVAVIGASEDLFGGEV